jgi:hypothetical protein
MALSGSFLSRGWYSSSKGDYIYLEFSWTATQSVVNNTSTISWALKGKRTASGYVMAGGFKVVIDGETVYNKSTDYRIELRNGTVVANGTKTIIHNDNGTRSFTASIQGALYEYAVNSTGSATFTLDNIPRKATMTAASDFTDLANPSISFSNPGGFPIDVWLEPNPVGDHLCIRTGIPNTGKYTWALTDAERDALRNKCAGKVSCPIRLGIYTHIGDTEQPDYQDKTYTITESTATKPSVSVGASINNGGLPSAFDGLYIQGKSKVNVTVSAAGKYGAGINSYSTTVDGKTYTAASFTTDILTKSGTITITSSVKDSRGFSNSASKQITVIPYSAPWITSFSAERQADGTTVIARLKGGVSPVDNKNSKAFSVTLNGVTKTISASAYEVDGSVTFTDIPTDVTLTAEAKITDAFSAVTKSATIPTVEVTMDFKANGKGVAFGKVAEKDGVDTPWNIYMKDSLVTTMANFQNNIGELGYQKLPGGLIIQWGTSVVGTEDTTINFPTAFSEACYVVVGNPKQYGKQSITFWNFTKSSFVMSSGGIRMNVIWIALGK